MHEKITTEQVKRAIAAGNHRNQAIADFLKIKRDDYRMLDRALQRARKEGAISFVKGAGPGTGWVAGKKK
jgi:hypothetical protein